MSDLRVSLVQANLVWEDKTANLQKIKDLLRGQVSTDLIILPEMFPTGFSMRPADLYENTNGPALDWMKKLADEKQAAVCGSIIVKDDDQYYNRLYFVKPTGVVDSYDKRHLFTLAGEEKVYSPGSKRLTVEWKGWKIMPLVCYDLRFPVWCRNDMEVDLQLYVANWPERRSDAWKTLLKARAIENMCYLAGVNRVGPDGNDINHSGDSALYDELGKIITAVTPGEEGVATTQINKERMLESRERFSFLKDRDTFEIKI